MPHRDNTTAAHAPIPRPAQELSSATAAELTALRSRLNELEQVLALEQSRSAELAKKLADQECSLSQATSLLDELSEHVPGMLYQTRGHTDGTSYEVPFISQRSQEFTGWSPQEIRDQPIRLVEAIHPDDRALYYEKSLHASHNLTPFNMEFRAINRKGDVRWLAVSSTPRMLGNGEAVYSGIALDITDRKRMEETLREANEQLERRVASRTNELQQLAERLQTEVDVRLQSESRLLGSQAQLSAIMEHAPDAIMEVGLDRRIVFINRVAPGHTMEQVIGSHVFDWTPGSIDLVRDKFDLLFNTGEPQNYENYVITAGGILRWYEIRMGVIRIEGRIVGATVIATEATERRRTEETLQSERRTLESILAHMPLGVFVCEMPSSRPVVWNQRLFEITGRPKPSDFLHFSQLSEHYQAFKRGTQTLYPIDELPMVRAMRGEPSRVDDMAVQRPDGTWVALEVIGSPILDAQGNVAFAMILVQDITERKQAESTLQTEQQFLRALIDAHEKDRSLMAYEIHDGLVQYITSALMHLESIAAEQLPTEFAQSTFTQATSLLRKSIVDARRMLSGLRPPILDEQGIVEAIKYLIAETESASEIDIDFITDVHFIRLEPLLEGTLFRIVQESLTNLRKHSLAKHAVVELHQMGDQIELVVRDRGVGFDPALVPVHRLGLQGVSRRAALMGGLALIDSRPGAGTTVRVRLPCLPAE